MRGTHCTTAEIVSAVAGEVFQSSNRSVKKKKKKKKKKKTGCICNQPGIDGISSNSNGRIWRKPTKCSCATMYGTMGRSIDIYILYTILDGSGSSEMILEEQSSIAVASMKTTPKPLEVTICKTHWFRICLISSG